MTLELVPFRGHTVPVLGADEISRYSVQDYLNWIQYSQNYMGTPAPITTYGSRPAEPISASFEGFVWGMLYAAGPVAAVEAYRLRVFGQAPLLYQDFIDGRGGDFFDDPILDRLREPWPAGNLSDLMKRSLVYGDFGGNAFILDLDDELVLVRPDWVEIVLEKRMHRGGQVGWRQRGIVYYEGGLNVGDGVPFLPGEYCHFVPGVPDPLATYRGMSWLTPLVREVQADKAASDHKVAFFENAASPNLAVSLPKEISSKQFEEFVDAMDAKHKGVGNAYKTLYTAGGADVTVIGANMQQMDFSAVQGKGETRVANAGGVPPTLLSFSEGMQGSSLNAGNYTAAKRNFVDTTMRDLWQNFAGSIQKMEAFRPPKEKSRLWYVGRDIPFMHEDAKDLAEIQGTQASTVSSYITAGFKPDTAVAAVERDDLKLLEHTGLTSVQLMPPGSQDADGDGVPDAEAEAADEYEAALDEFRSELVWHDEIVRKFNPDQPRDFHGRWSLTGAVIDALKAQGGEQDGIQFESGVYWDWSSYNPDTQTYNLELGDEDGAVQFEVGDYQLEQLFNSLTITQLRDGPEADRHAPAMAALATLGHSDHMVFDIDGDGENYIDWSTRTPAGDYGFDVGNADGDEVEFDLTPAELRKLIASLALSTQSRESVRSYIERRDYYDLRDYRGRFRKASDRIGHALNEWLGGRGDADDPLGDESAFSTASLRSAAKEFGITVPRARRGASEKEKRDQLKLALLKDARTRFRSERGQGEPSHRLTLSSPPHRDQDVGVYQEKSGKVSLYRESSTGQRGARIVSVDSLDALQQWGEDNGEPQVSSWAASERGVPVKKVAPRKAAPKKAPARKAPAKKAAPTSTDLVPAGKVDHDSGPLSEGELVALQLLSAQGWFSNARKEGGWVDSDQVTFMHRQHLDSLAEKGWIQKHVGATGEVSYRIDPRSAGAQKAAKDAADNPDAALVGDIEPKREEPEDRLSLSQIHLGAILQVHQDPNGTFDREPSGGSRPMRIKVQRIESIDENGERTNAILAPYQRIVGHDTETGRRVQSVPVRRGSYWSWVANPDSDVPADIEGEIVPDRKRVAAPTPAKKAAKKAVPATPATSAYAAAIRDGGGEGEIVRLLDADTSLTPSRLRELAADLGIDVPADARSRQRLQSLIAVEASRRFGPGDGRLKDRAPQPVVSDKLDPADVADRVSKIDVGGDIAEAQQRIVDALQDVTSTADLRRVATAFNLPLPRDRKFDAAGIRQYIAENIVRDRTRWAIEGTDPRLGWKGKPAASPAPAKKAAKKAVPAPSSDPTTDLSTLRAMPTEARRDALDERKLPELKAMLRAEGLPVSGRKRELVDRLVAKMDGPNAEPSSTSGVPATIPRPGPPVGRDISRDHDTLAPIYNANIDENGHWVESPAGDRALVGLAQQQGFDATPTVLTSAEFDRAIADGGHAVMYRGVNPDSWWGEDKWGNKLSGADVHAQTREGDYQPGYGVFGNGYYFATDKEKAESFSDGQPGSLGRYALVSDARVIDYEQLLREYGEWFDTGYASASVETQGMTTDFGRYAAARGYDAIRVPVGTRMMGGGKVAREEWVVLNRGALIADSGPS